MMNRESPFAHLRPTTTTEMLDRAYIVAARLWIVMWGAGLVYGANHLVNIALAQWGLPSMSSGWRVGLTLGTALLGDFAAAVALLSVFQGLIFPLRPVSMRAVFRTALRKFPGFFLIHLAYVITVAFCVLMAWRMTRLGLGDDADRTVLLLAAAMAVLAPVLAFRLCLAPIVCLIEDATPLPSFRRSWHLTAAWPKGLALRKDRPLVRLLLVLVLPLIVAGTLLMAGLAMGYYVFELPLPERSGASPAVSVLLELSAFIATAVALPLMWAGLMALYVEYRMRLEALDFYLRLRELSRDNAAEYPL